MATESLTFNLLARDRASRVFTRVGDAADRGDRSLSRFGASLGMLATRAAAGITVGLGAAAVGIARVGMQYEDSLNVFQAATRATGQQMDAVKAKAKALGANLTLPATSAADAAAAMTELAKGGLDVESSMRASLGTLRLAAAAQIDGAQAATIQVAALNQFRLGAQGATKVADVLANTANAASGEITDVAVALSYVGPVARSVGISISDTATSIGLLAKNGIISQKAGTSLRGIIVSLANPSEKAAKGLETLGVQAFNAQGKFVGMRSLVDQLAQAQGRLTDAQFAQAAAAAFGREPLAAVNALASSGAGSFDAMAKAVGRQGGAADLAAAKSRGLRGALEGVRSQLETVAISIYDRASPAVAGFLRGVADRIPAAAAAVAQFGAKVSGMAQDLARRMDLSAVLDRVRGFGARLVGTFAEGMRTGDWSAFGRTLGQGLGTAVAGSGGFAAKMMAGLAKLDWLSMGKQAATFAFPFAVGFVNNLMSVVIKFVRDNPMEAAVFVGSIIPFGRVAGLLEKVIGRLPIVGPILRAVSRSGRAVEGAFGKVFRGAGRALDFLAPNLARGVRNAMDTVVTTVYVRYSDALRAMARVGRGMLSGLLRPLAGLGDRAGSVVAGGIRSIVGQFRGAGGWLVRAGRAVISGLVSGIASMFGAVRGKLGELTSKITSWKGPESTDKRLLVPAGKMLMDGLSRGIVAGSRQVRRTLQGVTEQIRRQAAEIIRVGSVRLDVGRLRAVSGAAYARRTPLAQRLADRLSGMADAAQSRTEARTSRLGRAKDAAQAKADAAIEAARAGVDAAVESMRARFDALTSAAEGARDAAVSALDDMRSRAQSAYSAVSGSISGLFDPANIGSRPVSTMQGFVRLARRFVAALSAMRANGLPAALIQQVAAAGPVSGLGAAEAFARLDTGGVREAAGAFSDLQSLATAGGSIAMNLEVPPRVLAAQEAQVAALTLAATNVRAQGDATVAALTAAGDRQLAQMQAAAKAQQAKFDRQIAAAQAAGDRSELQLRRANEYLSTLPDKLAKATVRQLVAAGIIRSTKAGV